MNKVAENLIDLFREVRVSSLKRFHSVPAGMENWRVSEKKMSIADILVHLIESDKWTMKKLKNPSIKAIDGITGAVVINSRSQYDDLISEFESLLEKKILAVKNMSMWDFDKLVYDDRFGKDVNLWFVIMRGNIDHEIHHRGQISAYLQMMETKGN